MPQLYHALCINTAYAMYNKITVYFTIYKRVCSGSTDCCSIASLQLGITRVRFKTVQVFVPQVHAVGHLKYVVLSEYDALVQVQQSVNIYIYIQTYIYIHQCYTVL